MQCIYSENVLFIFQFIIFTNILTDMKALISIDKVCLQKSFKTRLAMISLHYQAIVSLRHNFIKQIHLLKFISPPPPRSAGAGDYWIRGRPSVCLSVCPSTI